RGKLAVKISCRHNIKPPNLERIEIDYRIDVEYRDTIDEHEGTLPEYLIVLLVQHIIEKVGLPLANHYGGHVFAHHFFHHSEAGEIVEIILLIGSPVENECISMRCYDLVFLRLLICIVKLHVDTPCQHRGLTCRIEFKVRQ